MTRPISILLLLWSVTTVAHDNFVSNPNLPYPPGCAGDPGRSAALVIRDHRMELYDYEGRRPHEVRLDVWRSGCSEAGRSVIWLRITARRASQPLLLRLPFARAILPNGNLRELRLAEQPNGWGVNVSAVRGWTLLEYQPGDPGYPVQKSWTFVVDNPIPEIAWGDILSADQYNGSFTLNLYDWVVWHASTDLATIAVPATGSLLQNDTGMPLNGRLSGLWAFEGAADQGLTLTIADRIAPADTVATPRGEGPLVLILQHYTYDAEGNPLWLTGAADFEQGAQQVALSILRVDHGAFGEDRPAQRDVVGRVHITANGCNDLTFEYDYSAIGLGQGSRHARRLYSLETAGYDCRDYAARVAANR